MSDYAEEENDLLSSVEALLGRVLPLGIVTFVMITAAVTILAWASWLGGVLFQIPAKDSLSIFTGPIILLAVSITLIGSFQNHKLIRTKKAPFEPRSAAVLSNPSKVNQFTHALVPGGKDDETIPYAAPVKTPTMAATPRTRAPAQNWSFGSPEVLDDKDPVYEHSHKHWEQGSTFIPPDRLEPRIDAFSFNCHECNGVVDLPWAKIKESLGGKQLTIDCPGCHRQYPFDYDLAKRKTLSITFHGVESQDSADNEEPGEHLAAEPAGTVGGNTLHDVTDMEPQSPTVETVPPIGTKAKAHSRSFRNNKLFQTLGAPLRARSAGIFAKSSKVKQFNHVLVPGGKDAETVPGPTPFEASTKGAKGKAFDPPKQLPFKDRESLNGSENQKDKEPSPAREQGQILGPPDRLEARIDAFQFQCQECSGVVNLPWAKIRDGLGKDQLSIDCPSCHRQYPFDYEQAKRKTLSITFHGVINQGPLENPPKPSPAESFRPVEPTKTDGILGGLELTPPASPS